MLVVSLAPVPVASVIWRVGSGAWTLSVICKLSLQLVPGDAELCKQHDPIHEEDELGEDPSLLSPWSPSDLVPTRPLVDVSLVGEAFSARGVPVTSLTPRLRVGTIDKALRVDALESGDPPQSFRQAALGYDFASAGATNPVGGKEGERARSRYRILPFDAGIINPDHTSPGFGPIPAHWPSRQRLLGEHGAPTIVPYGPPCVLPEGFDLKYFNAAPPDQQLPELEPNAELELQHLHPQHAILRTRLPNLAPQVFVERPERRGRQEYPARITALWIDTRRAVATLTWHCPIELGSLEEPGRAWVAVAGPGRRLSGPQLSKLIASLRGAAPSAEERGGGEDEPTAEEVADPLNQTVSIRARTAVEAAAPAIAVTSRETTETSLLSHDQLAHIIDRSERTAENMPFKHDDGMPAWMSRQRPATRPPPPPSRSAPVSTAAASAGPTHTGAGAAPPQAPVPMPIPPAPLSSASLGPRPRATTSMGIGPAAAGAIGSWPASPVTPPPEASPQAQSFGDPTPSRAAPASSLPDEVTELLWFDEEATSRIRRRWRTLAEALDFAPRDDSHDLATKDPKKARDHHCHFGVLTQAEADGREGMRRALREAVSHSGRFTPPLVLLRGKLSFPFEDVEILRATAATVTPVAGDDKKLGAALEQVKELLETPLLSGSRDTVANFTQHLRKLYKEARRTLSLDYLDEAVERMLLEQRRYHHRSLFGGNWIRAQLELRGSDKPIPAYLPEGLDKQLPMMVSFETRLIAEAHVRQDQYESHPHALRVVTLGRVVSLDG